MYESQILERILGSSPEGEGPVVQNYTPGVKVTIHYWDEFNKGKHLMLDVDTGPEFSILDLINQMRKCISINNWTAKAAEDYVVRNASKDGKPKTDMPVFQINQKVQNAGFLRFVLCDKELDGKAKESTYERSYSWDDNQDTNNTEIKTQKCWKKIFCCFG